MSKLLPFLPGYNVEIPTKKNHAKSHIFDVKNSLLEVKDPNAKLSSTLTADTSLEARLTINQVPEDFKEDMMKSSKVFAATQSGMPAKQPQWIKYDRMVLRFFAYFKESVHASQLENYRVRKCVIYFYLEDGSLHIAEPRIENSGIPQGVFVKRHRVPKADGTVLGLEDLYVGAELSLYSRVFRIVDADDFTRMFYEKELGAKLGNKEEYPLDPFTKKQTTKPAHFHKMMHPMKLFMEASKGKFISQISSTKQFLDYDGKVLRFYCVWSDDSLYGEKRPYIIHYFLADDTIEVVEIQQPNSGRQAFPALLKRQKLPKHAISNNPDLARIGVQGKDEKVEYYTSKDLKVGMTISVFTRELQLVGCDKFTQNYYVTQFGADPEDYHELVVEEEVEEVPKMIPPSHNGIGTEEDSLGSFLYLVPKVPKKDFKKLMENDGICLRYSAKFVDPQVEDKDRRFIITFYPSNDTVSVFEKFERNSGFQGGKFMERTRIKNPASNEYFKATDFYVGANLGLNKYRFEITEVDEYTKTYMRETYGEKYWEQGSVQVMEIASPKLTSAPAKSSAAPSAAPAASSSSTTSAKTTSGFFKSAASQMFSSSTSAAPASSSRRR